MTICNIWCLQKYYKNIIAASKPMLETKPLQHSRVLYITYVHDADLQTGVCSESQEGFAAPWEYIISSLHFTKTSSRRREGRAPLPTRWTVCQNSVEYCSTVQYNSSFHLEEISTAHPVGVALTVREPRTICHTAQCVLVGGLVGHCIGRVYVQYKNDLVNAGPEPRILVPAKIFTSMYTLRSRILDTVIWK